MRFTTFTVLGGHGQCIGCRRVALYGPLWCQWPVASGHPQNSMVRYGMVWYCMVLYCMVGVYYTLCSALWCNGHSPNAAPQLPPKLTNGQTGENSQILEESQHTSAFVTNNFQTVINLNYWHICS